LEDWATGNETRFLNWRTNLYRTVAAWVCAEAAAVVTDAWEAMRRRPADEEEDTRQEQAARANAVLAAPGDLRHAVTIAAQRRGAAVRRPVESLAGVHHGCPASPAGALPAEARAERVMVTCTACGRTVDQDVVMLHGMLKTW
jgi:hypothetical protein